MKECEEFAPLLSAFVDGELTEEERAEVLAHVSECEKCRRLLGELTALHAALGDAAQYPNLRLMPPPDYPDFVRLMASCTLVLTDSGGIQEEAPSLGKPVLVMRDTSERPEAIAAGTALLVGTDSERIISEVSVLLDNPEAYRRMSRAVNPYGDGKACARIIAALH